MLKKLIIISLLTFSNLSLASSPNLAHRDAKQDWHDIPKKTLKHFVGEGDTIVDKAILWNASNFENQQKMLSNVPVWPDYKTIQEQFEFLKTNRFMIDPIENNVTRTIPWRYPIDYCFERAAAAASLYNHDSLPRPAKVFAFGNMSMYSPFGPEDKASLNFWYHVAPIIRDKQTNLVYVLDPSLNYDAPLPLESWLKQTVEFSEDKKLNVNICNGYASVPYDVCSTATPHDEKSHSDNLISKLPAEWEHMQARGVNSHKVLANDQQTTELAGKAFYGSISIDGIGFRKQLKDLIKVQYKTTNESDWNILIDVNNIIAQQWEFGYLTSTTTYPIGTIFGKKSRSATCQCSYYSCHCVLPNNSNSVELRVILNDDVIKQCSYQYPNDKNIINAKMNGPDVNFHFKMEDDGTIDMDEIDGSIEGCI